MDEAAFKERVKRLKTVNAVIKQLEPALHEAAFDLLKAYVTTSTSGTRQASGTEKQARGEAVAEGAEEFFTKHEHEEDADNAVLAAAFHYSQYGDVEFSPDEISEIADEAGVTVPDRLDMVFLRKRNKRGGKNLFRRGSRGHWKPTAAGRSYFKDTYSVKKGTAAKPTEDKE